MSKKIQNKIEELLFEVYEKGLQQETTDLTAYYKKIQQALNIPVVVFSEAEVCGKPNCNRPKLDSSPLCAYHFDIANS